MYTFCMEVGEEDLGGGEPRKIAPVDSDVLYAFTWRSCMIQAPSTQPGIKWIRARCVSSDREAFCSLTAKLHPGRPAPLFTIKKNSYDAQYVVKTNTQEKRTFIGELEDFVLQARRKSSLWTESGSNNMILSILLNTLK